MKKVLFIAILFCLTFSALAQLPATDSVTASMLPQHIAMQYKYHGIEYVLKNTEKITVGKKDKTEYQAYVMSPKGMTWVPTTIRVGEQYLKFDGKYYFNVTQNVMLAKVEQPKPQKVKQRNQGFPGIASDGMPGWRTN